MAWLQLKGEQLSGSAYYFNGCKALMFSSVVHFNQGTRQLGTWVKAAVSSFEGLKMTEARPVAVWTGPSVPALSPKSLPYETDSGSHRRKKEEKKEKCSKLNSAAARESQT